MSSSPIRSSGFYKSVGGTSRVINDHNSRVHKKTSASKPASGLFGRLKKYLGNVVERYETDDANVNNVRSILGIDSMEAVPEHEATQRDDLQNDKSRYLARHNIGTNYRDIESKYSGQNKRVSFRGAGHEDIQISTLKSQLKEKNELIDMHNQTISSLNSKYDTALKNFNVEIEDLERKNQKALEEQEALSKENSELITKNKELKQKMALTIEEYDKKFQELSKEETKLASQLLKLERRSKELENLEIELHYRQSDLDQREKSMKELELKSAVMRELTQVKETSEKRRVKLDQEAIQIKTMIDKHSDEFKRLRKLHGYSIEPISLRGLESSDLFKSIFEKIDNEIEFLQAYNNDKDISVEQIDNPTIEEQFRSFNEELLRNKASKEEKLKELSETLLVMNPKSNSNPEILSDIRKLYVKKYKVLFKLRTINQILSKMNIVFEYQEDSKVLQQFSKRGHSDIQEFYGKLKREIEERYL
ncbi:uncharacterized protein CANTADRAFT_5055 [Suhomyces tanzawaensis NRRL Y-17324]|uniref:Uncharacterized protein n=1 Tax=Suhomyces tanzawaensis NRRL Y-17324 TaxID=984487 RepID=A0A1E4SNI4_9ASCO|nr:uncharacterized protein CANTADRAFT_5055 [Suhomyces tanzawaensis NRRL Y-17324]ODV81084.1 hypothetical protein CANTADRAFT_5055 [Suhomyces tanzawaensis NRRL Y-17324]